MSRTPLTRRPVRAVLALTVGAASLVGLGQASAAPPAPVTFAVTGVSPAYVEAQTDSAFGVTLTGKGFTRATQVSFGGDCAGVTVPPTTVTATKLAVKPPSCSAGVKDVTVTKGTGTAQQTSVLRGKLTFLEKPAIEPGTAPGTAVTPGAGPWSGGTLASLRLTAALPAKPAVQVLFTTDGVTKAVAAKADTVDPRKVSFKVPPGLPGGTPQVAVSVFGILSEELDAQFRYVSTIRTSPAVWVKDAARPTLKIDGAGFTAGSTVTVCDLPASPVEGKAPTAKTLFVTPPAWSSLPAGAQATGTVCTVQVTTGSEVSALTAGSTFTYAAY